jgi:outer membrane protein
MKKINLELFVKWQFPAVLLLIVYAATVSTVSLINSPKLGYVDSGILLNSYERIVSAREEINKQSIDWQTNIKTLEGELNVLNIEFLNNSDGWNKKTREVKQEDFAKKQNELAKYSQAIKLKTAELEQKLMLPVFNHLNNRLKNFGEEKGYDIIFGTVSGGSILYSRQVNDLTDEFLRFISEKE